MTQLAAAYARAKVAEGWRPRYCERIQVKGVLLATTFHGELAAEAH